MHFQPTGSECRQNLHPDWRKASQLNRGFTIPVSGTSLVNPNVGLPPPGKHSIYSNGEKAVPVKRRRTLDQVTTNELCK